MLSEVGLIEKKGGRDPWKWISCKKNCMKRPVWDKSM